MQDIRILLLEDTESDRELISRELKIIGLPTIRFESTRRGFLDALSTFRPTVVLADYQLGSFDARQALQLLRKTEPDIPFILITGTLDENLAADILRAGADDYLLKDRLGRLGSAIHHTLRLRQLRKQLAERETLLRRIFDTEPECVKVLDEKGRILEMNPAGVEMLEAASIDDIRQQSVYRFIAPEYREPFKEQVGRVFAGEAVRGKFEVVGLKGRRLWMETNAVPLRDAAGRITGLLGITRDITKSKALEEQLRQSQKLEAVGHLAGGVAHDFNNILMIIAGYTTLTLSLPGITNGVRKNIMGIQNSVSRAAGLTKQLLAFSRKQIPQLRVLDFNKTLSNIATLVTRTIGEDIRLKLHLDPKVGNIKADPSQVEQVVMNLAINARDAMPSGGSLIIETAKVDVPEPIEQHGLRCESGTYVRLRVVDEGIGMNSQIMSRMFEPFFTTKEPGKGTGLGLSTVYGIVRQNGGAITVDSVSGDGTSIDVYFPVTNEPVTRTSTSKHKSLQGTERILVVEDDRELGELVRSMLGRFGYEVTLAESGGAAIRLLESQHDFDLVLTDVVMPGVSGVELGRHLEKHHLDIKTIYMTGYSEDVIAQHGQPGIHAGICTIEKPFSPETLATTVRHVLDR